jgi:hypothetical protein
MSASAKSFQHHTTPRRNGNFLSLAAVGIVLATMFTPTNAYFDQGICCMLKVREEIAFFQDNPWSVCDTDHSYVYLSPGPYTSVPATMAWCEQNCGGYQRSSADEWLRPLATWVLPTVALLLICSVGEMEEEPEEERGPREENGQRLRRGKICSWRYWVGYLTRDPPTGIRYKVREYIALLGDPASAICGGFSEIVTDARILGSKPRDWSKGRAVRVATLAGSTEFNEVALRRKSFTNVETKEPTTSESETPAVTSDVTIDRLRPLSGVRVILKARLDIINAVFLPVVLLLATTVSSFHDAYDQTGDVETAHNLSYGIWYSWVIILAVVSNSCAASANPGVARAAFGGVVANSTLPLRKRFPNAMAWGNWVRWVFDNAEDVYYTKYFYYIYIGGQLFGWTCVAFACACASVISYTTPTMGVGCDTFTYILYGSLSLVVALLLVLRHWVWSKVSPDEKGSPVQRGSRTNKPPHSAWKIIYEILKVIYAVLVSLNAFVLFGGTLFHLIGLYRSCRCQALFGSPSAIVELNFFTQQAIDNATRFWLPVGYVCFSFVWVICMIAIVLRAYLHYHFHIPWGYFSPQALKEDNLQTSAGCS